MGLRAGGDDMESDKVLSSSGNRAPNSRNVTTFSIKIKNVGRCLYKFVGRLKFDFWLGLWELSIRIYMDVHPSEETAELVTNADAGRSNPRIADIFLSPKTSLLLSLCGSITTFC
jgi:hypothetical protein